MKKILLAIALLLWASQSDAQLIRPEMVTNGVDALTSTTIANTNPQPTDDTNAGHKIRDIWINDQGDSDPGNDTIFVAVSVTAGAARWQQIGGAGGGSTLQTTIAAGNTYHGADCTAGKAVRVGLDANTELWLCHDATFGIRAMPVINGVADDADKTTLLLDGKYWYVKNKNTGEVVAKAKADGTDANMRGLPTGWSLPIVTGATLTATDDAVNYIRVPFAQTITKVCAKTDAGTISVQLQRDDGSATNMLSASLSAATTEACTTSFVSGENVLAQGNYVDVLIVSIDSGTPTRLTVSVEGRRD